MFKHKNNRKGVELIYDQLELPPRIYNCLKRSNRHTLLDFLDRSQKDLMKIEDFHIEE